MRDEFERIAGIADILGSAPGHDVIVGIGDDAAVLQPDGAKRIVWTVDEQVEGTHFRREWLSLEDVGYRAVMAAASDVCAMGGKPSFALSALSLPSGLTDAELEALVRGQKLAAGELRLTIVGGNIAAGPVLAVTTTVLGSVGRPVLRAGAVPGDGLWVAGDVGFAAAALKLLEGFESPPERLVRAWRRPEARVADGARMGGRASAAIDVSDGLAQDAAHLARAGDVKVVFDEVALKLWCDAPEMVHAIPSYERRLSCVLHGGEDYALLATSSAPLEGFIRVGHVAEGAGVALMRDGEEVVVAPEGFDHFRRR